MNTLNLSQIIDLSIESKTGILIETICSYKRSLLTYFKDYYLSEPVLVVTAVFNAAQYGFIAPANELHEAVETYLSDMEEGEDKEAERELIMFNSILLEKL